MAFGEAHDVCDRGVAQLFSEPLEVRLEDGHEPFRSGRSRWSSLRSVFPVFRWQRQWGRRPEPPALRPERTMSPVIIPGLSLGCARALGSDRT